MAVVQSRISAEARNCALTGRQDRRMSTIVDNCWGCPCG